MNEVECDAEVIIFGFGSLLERQRRATSNEKAKREE